VVWLTGKVAEPVGRVNCRSSAAGRSGEKLMEAAFVAVHVRVAS